MHEMSLVRELVKAVLEECNERTGVTRVTSVNLVVGEARDVVEQYVPELFRYLARGTVAQDAVVSIRRTPLKMSCHACGDIFGIDLGDARTWRCPRCGARDYSVFSGEEFLIESIEVEFSSNGGAAGFKEDRLAS